MSNLESLGLRAIAALARHERAAAELGRIKKQIVVELEKCPITIEAHDLGQIGNDFTNPTQEQLDRLWDGSRVSHHLHQALQERSCDDRDRERRLEDSEIRAELGGYGENEQLECAHCLAAWDLVMLRKDGRKEFGHAKRVLRQLGKSAIKALA